MSEIHEAVKEMWGGLNEMADLIHSEEKDENYWATYAVCHAIEAAGLRIAFAIERSQAK